MYNEASEKKDTSSALYFFPPQAILSSKLRLIRAVRSPHISSRRQILVNPSVSINRSEGTGRAGALMVGLSPDTRYALRLAAHNDVGASAHTSPLHFTTREEGELLGRIQIITQVWVFSLLKDSSKHVIWPITYGAWTENWVSGTWVRLCNTNCFCLNLINLLFYCAHYRLLDDDECFANCNYSTTDLCVQHDITSTRLYYIADDTDAEF